MLNLKVMKLRSTTPVLANKKPTKILLVGIALIMAVAVPVTMSQLTSAESISSINQKIKALEKKNKAYESSIKSLKSTAKTLNGKIASYQKEQNILQNQIDINQAKSDKLELEIDESKAKIEDNKKALGNTIADLYVNSNTSTLEMLASSSNIGDYIDKQTQQNSVRDSLAKTIDEINVLKAKLEKQQQGVKFVLSNQNNARKALEKSKSEQQKLLNETKGKENAYRKLKSKNQAQQDSLAERAAKIQSSRATSGSVISSGVDGNYPWNSNNCPMQGWVSYGGADGNGTDGKGYGCRQCTSYVAWKAARETGRYPIGWGDAKDFPAYARAAKMKTGYTAKAGSIAVMKPAQSGGPAGHVAWVESVNGDGTMIVSQYNYNYGAGWGKYSKMKMYTNQFSEYIYFK